MLGKPLPARYPCQREHAVVVLWKQQGLSVTVTKCLFTTARWQDLVVGLGGHQEFGMARSFMNADRCPETLGSSSGVPLAKLLSSKRQGRIIFLCTSNLISRHQRWLPTGWCCVSFTRSQTHTHRLKAVSIKVLKHLAKVFPQRQFFLQHEFQ